MTDEQITKQFKMLEDKYNDKFKRIDDALRVLIEGNSNAIDDIVVSMLGGDELV